MGRIIATEHVSLDGVVEAPGPGGIGDHPHKGWVFDFEPGETGERYKVDEALAAEVLLLARVSSRDDGRVLARVRRPVRGQAERDAEVRAHDHARGAVRSYRMTTKPTRRDL
jgi:hypothetical protein